MDGCGEQGGKNGVYDIVVRKARIAEAKEIHAILMEWSAREMLLSRSLSQIYTHIRDFFVLCGSRVEAGGSRSEQVLGCCALSIFWEDLAEIRSLAVKPECCGCGYGKRLINAAVEEARTFGMKRLFALTYQVEFFRKSGFLPVGKDTLPQKVWSDCINCPRFPDCDEVAVERFL